MRNVPHIGLSRRGLLLAGGGLAAAALMNAGPVYAEVPDSRLFDLGGAGGNPVLRKSLHANWVMQSFAYDNVHQHIYFVQVNSTNTNPANVGDLWITKTDTAGKELGSMTLHGFGHGVSIAVEPYDGAVYLWTEWRTSESGFGTKIGRFPFVNGSVLEQDSTAIQDRTPAIGGDIINPQPVIDPSTDRLLVRYKTGADLPRLVVFKLSDARAGRMATEHRVAARALPSRGAWGTDNPFQGYTAYGRYAYLFEGKVNGPSYITVIDINDVGQSIVTDRAQTNAGASLPGREPQGMAIWMHSSGPRLAFGFHSNTAGVRQSTVFYKSQFV
ncbi:phage baseplate protein [Nonomuraea sp. NPDC002799]